jgi:hypothetical protein
MLAALLFVLVLGGSVTGICTGQRSAPADTPSPEDDFWTVHNLRKAQEITLGTGTRVGVLGQAFHARVHPGLYRAWVDFRGDNPENGQGPPSSTHLGYWMSLTLHEIAPEAEVVAMEVPGKDAEIRMVKAVIRALAWAVEHDLDVVTGCIGPLSRKGRGLLAPAVERAAEAGVVLALLDFDHPANLLPGSFGPSATESPVDPDLTIYSQDCTSVLAGEFQALVQQGDDGLLRKRPFLARFATGPITAGLVALVRSSHPDASSGEVKRILLDTSRPMVYQGRRADRVPDALRAVTAEAGVLP